MPAAADSVSASPIESTRARAGFALLVGLILLFAAAKPILYDTLDPDLFWHLRTADQLLHDGIAPLNDRFSFASIHEPWVPYSWLAELAMRQIWRCDGLRGAVLGAAVMMAAYLGFIALAAGQMRRTAAGGSEPQTFPSRLASVCAVAFAGIVTLPYLSFRPVTLALVILAACAYLLMRDRRLAERSRAVVLIVPLTALLVNIHLLAVMAPAWIGCLTAGSWVELRRLGGNGVRTSHGDASELRRRLGRYLVLLLCTSLALLCTPMLGGVVKTFAHFGKGDALVGTIISETAPFWTGPAGKLSLALVVCCAICVSLRFRRIRLGELFWLILGCVALLRMGRFAPIFAIIAAPLFAVTLPPLSDRLLANRGLIALLACILLAGTIRIIGQLPTSHTELGTWLNRHGPSAPGYPSSAADFLAAHIKPRTGQIINEFSWGGYLGWRLGDRYRVLLDERTQLYSSDFWHATYLDGPVARARFLSTLHADAAVLPTRKSIFREHLLALGWTTAYSDDRASVLTPPLRAGEVARPARERQVSMEARDAHN
jgi:hypothetical protein